MSTVHGQRIGARPVASAIKAAGSFLVSRPGSFLDSAWAIVEGSLTTMGSYMMDGESIGGWLLTEEERACFASELPGSCQPKKGGRPKLTERVKITFKAGARIFGTPTLVDFSGSGYQSFCRAIKVRDRLVHPKQSTDMELGDHDLDDIAAARDWFVDASAQRFWTKGALVGMRRLLEEIQTAR